MKLTNELCDELFAQESLEKKRAVILVLTELRGAEEKHPKWPKDLIHRAAIVGEEAGELLQASLQHGYEQGRFYDMMKEASHTAATALRFIITMPVKPIKFGLLKKSLAVLFITLYFSTNAQSVIPSPCDDAPQIGYSVGCHTYCVPGTYRINESFCNWQRITPQYCDTTTCVFTVDGGAPTQTASIIFTPGAAGITNFTLDAWVVFNNVQCHQQISWTFTTVVCEYGSLVGLYELSLQPDPAEKIYFDLQGNRIDKIDNELIIEQQGLKRKKVFFTQ